jgi:hypothetical protein
MSRIEAKGHRGILLLHDIHPATAMALPMLLRELKAKGYRIVQAVPAGERPKTLPEPQQPTLVADAGGGWPRLLKTDAAVTGSTKTRAAKHERARHQKRERFARHNHGRDPVVTATISKKRQKTKTLVSDTGWTRFQR